MKIKFWKNIGDQKKNLWLGLMYLLGKKIHEFSIDFLNLKWMKK